MIPSAPPDGHKDEIFMEKYRAIDVSFDEIVLLCEPLVPNRYLSSAP